MLMGYSMESWSSVLQYFIMVIILFIMIAGLSIKLSNLVDNNITVKKILKKSHFIDIE